MLCARQAAGLNQLQNSNADSRVFETTMKYSTCLPRTFDLAAVRSAISKRQTR